MEPLTKDNISVVSINVNGIGQKDKRDKVLKALREYNADVFFLQETHVRTVREWHGLSFSSYGTSKSAGSAILFRKNLGLTVNNQCSDFDGRIVSVKTFIHSQHVNFVSIYAPNNPAARKIFFSEELPKFLSVDHMNIVGGDFNCVGSLNMDTLNHSNISCTLVGHAELCSTVSDFDLEDKWRVVYPQCKSFTWANKAGTQASRLDRFYIPADLVVEKYEISVFPFSDHKVIQIVLPFAQSGDCQTPKVTHWKLNTSILEEQEYKNKIKKLFNDMATLMEAFDNIAHWWDDLKRRIKIITIAYCSARKVKQQQDCDHLRVELEACKPGPEYALLKDRLREMYESRYRITNIKSDFEKDLLDEKCSSYFFRRTRERRKRNFVKCVRNTEGELVNGTDKVLDVFREFYGTLYQKHEGRSGQDMDWLFSHPSQTQQSSSEGVCDGSGEVTFETDKLKECLRGMSVSKSPGSDGLPAEFYLTFFDDIAPYILMVFSATCENEVMPESWKEAVTTLIQKDGDATDPANQRPISLLNSDYKLFAKYLNEHYVQQHLELCIPPQQLCSVKGRSIHDGLILIRDIIEYNRAKDGHALIVALDQKKAFDMVDHEVLFQALSHLGFSNQIVNLVRMLYKGNHTRIKVNGELSDTLYINRGVRQGCPLSASLYVVYLQIFLNVLNGGGLYGIDGIKTPGGSCIKTSAYADDLVLFCRDEYDVKKCFNLFQEIARITGSQLNKDKTEILNLSTPRITTELQQYLRGQVKICGIVFANEDFKEISKRNVTLKLERIQKKLEKLKFLNVTLTGRVLLVNSIIHSQLYYLSGVYLPAKKDLEDIRRLSFRFLWNEKQEVIKRKTIETSKDHGGLGLNNLVERCNAIYFDCNVQKPSRDNFNHQRLALFKYFYAFYVRGLYPHVFSNSQPHNFKLADPYKAAHLIFVRIEDKLELVAPSQVSCRQLYNWLLPEEEDVPIVLNLEEREHGRLFNLWRDGIISVKDKDLMWRTAMGGLKTGSFISKYNIPGAKLGCKFCPAPLETAEHLLLRCPSLRIFRDEVVSSAKDIGCEVRPQLDNDREMLLQFGLCPKPESSIVSRNVFSIVAKSFRALWLMRNEAHFGTHAAEPAGLVDVIRGYRQKLLHSDGDNL